MAADGEHVEVAQPVRYIPSDDRLAPDDGTALCLSGGGYRAMLFHLGALWRLNEAGRLRSLDRISSVSGGSITAGVLAHRWNELEWDAQNVAQNFPELVVEPIRKLAEHTIDEAAVAVGLLTSDTVGDRVADAYSEHLFDDLTLQDLPEAPTFVLNATNLASGELWRFTKAYMGDWRVGLIHDPKLALAKAVAASSAFPPVLSPFTIDLSDATWETVEGNDLTTSDFRSKVQLTDGGVYDNLGLETAWKRCRTVLVSDAGGHMKDVADTHDDWVRQSLRVMKMLDNQVRDLRKRQVEEGYESKAREGVYWGIRSDVSKYAPNALACPFALTHALAEVPTRLKKLDAAVQERLINWGYAITDAGLRSWLKEGIANPKGFPCQEAGVG